VSKKKRIRVRGRKESRENEHFRGGSERRKILGGLVSGI
jgi:hypothetical protein